MGNVTTKSVGNFQANVGKVSADISVIISYVIAGILVLTAIGFTIIALIPMSPWDCEDLDDLKQTKDRICNTNPQSPICIKSQNDYNKENKRCNTKVRHTALLWVLLLIPLAVFIVFFSKWWDKYVHTNKTAAQIGGTLFELNTLGNLMRT